jgi:alpha-beta hydrolase superfamily lysophospholipase
MAASFVTIMGRNWEMKEYNYIAIKQKDGHTTRLTQLCSQENPRASILILHGMAEHQKRYFEFAKYLSRNGFDVYLYDHRGHGTDKKLSELGFFTQDKGYQAVVEDAINISTYINQNNRSGKLFLLGHSMGSLIARNVIQEYDKYHGVILSGTTYPSKPLTVSGLLITSIIKKLKGPKHISPFINNLLFGSKKYTKLSDRTAFDWLSRSNPVVGAYMHDPYCGFTCTASFYHDLLKLTSNASKKNHIRLTKADLPLFIVSGENDPVGGYTKEIKKYIALLKKLGFHNVASKLYPECRHELLNELNHEEVYSDLLQWLTKQS